VRKTPIITGLEAATARKPRRRALVAAWLLVVLIVASGLPGCESCRALAYRWETRNTPKCMCDRECAGWPCPTELTPYCAPERYADVKLAEHARFCGCSHFRWLPNPDGGPDIEGMCVRNPDGGAPICGAWVWSRTRKTRVMLDQDGGVIGIANDYGDPVLVPKGGVP
jgi:hypothetical protein